MHYPHFVHTSSSFSTSDKLQLALVFVTFLAIIAALVIALYQDEWRERRRRSKISVMGVVSHLQYQETLNSKHKLLYLRLMLNNSAYLAGKVEVSVLQIAKDSIKRENFLEVPLNWTHGQVYDPSGVVRDIQRNQTAYLDVCSGPTDYKSLHLCTGVTGNADFRDLNPGKTTLTLVLFQQSGENRYITIEINWEEGSRPKFHFIKMTSTAPD